MEKTRAKTVRDSIYKQEEMIDDKGNIKEKILKEMINEFIDRSPIIYERLAKL